MTQIKPTIAFSTIQSYEAFDLAQALSTIVLEAGFSFIIIMRNEARNHARTGSSRAGITRY